MRICEIYSREVVAFKNYMKNPMFDYHNHWYDIVRWIDEHDEWDVLNNAAGTEWDNYEDATDDDIDPDVFLNFPARMRGQIEDEIYGNLSRDDPSMLPTHRHADYRGVVKRNEWLVHFSDHASEIAANGFVYGVDNMDQLGLTNYFGKSAKQYGGYNFAFVANSRDALGAANRRKYGDSFVMFRNAGVKMWHYGDEEDQVVFWGKDIDPRMIVQINRVDGEFAIIPRGEWKGSQTREYLIKGEYRQVVNWVMTNFDRYRKVLTGH